jgi:tRNA/tmRNA/rRNA uracil-C5-methylase (TrmA/RlmC/RlmD family)
VKINEAEIVLLDPPRSGAELVVLEQIVKLAPRRICYISCDPASLARDTQRLAERGYQLVQSAAFDLFPQTAHIECVFTFEPVIS